MKKIFSTLVLLSLITALSSCGSSSSQPVSEKSSEEPSVTSQVEVSSDDIVSSSKEESSEPEPSSNPDHPMITDQLYTDSGLKVYFKAQGARIDKITWGSKQIAKDGFTVGRCANRIANGKFSIDGTQYTAKINASPHSLHGGGNSWQGPFATANWTKVEQTAYSITYSIHDSDGSNGYPGNMDMTVKYTLSEEGELKIEYRATTDKATLCNPTNHIFFAINGNNSYDNIDLMIDADNYTPLSNQIPTGEIASVAGTQFDYREKKAFDKSNSYDDNYVLNGEGFRHVATLTGNTSKLAVLVHTDRPGLQLYKDNSGNICLETQMMPDAINHEAFENPILRPGEEFYSKTSYTFLAID